MTGGRLATQAVLMATVVVVPRVLGVESYGRYAAVMAVAAMLQTASAFGLPLVEMRFLAPLWRSARGEAIPLASSIWSARLALSVLAGAAAAVWLRASPELGLSPALVFAIGLFCVLRYASDATRSLFLSLGRPGGTVGLELARALLTLPVVVLGFLAAGLTGVFLALPAAYALLLAVGVTWLRRLAPLRPGRARWSSLRPHLDYSFASFVGTLAGMVQVKFAIYAVARFVAAAEAGFLAIAVQLFALAQALLLSGRRALTPLLAELEAHGQSERLRRWGGVMMRYAVSLSVVAAVVFALVGEPLVRWVWTDAFAPVHACGVWILVGLAFYCAGASCNGLLYVRGLARRAAANSVVYAAATIGGLALVVRGGDAGTAQRITAVYAAAAAIFFASAYLSLGRRGGLWLPLRRTLLLLAPLLLAAPASVWDAALPARLGAAALFAVLYATLAIGLRLLPAGEIGAIAAALRGRGPTPEPPS